MKPLKFIHISKTGGTTIENVAIEKNIKWGKRDIEYSDYTHTLTKFTDIKIINQNDWFTVVRNPYSRIVSEFNFFFKIAFQRLPNQINENEFHPDDWRFIKILIKHVNMHDEKSWTKKI
jgi:hypothetical protein